MTSSLEETLRVCLSRRYSFCRSNRRLFGPLRLATLVDDLDTAANDSPLRAQVQAEHRASTALPRVRPTAYVPTLITAV